MKPPVKAAPRSLQSWALKGGPQDIFYHYDEEWPFPIITSGHGLYLEDDQGRRYMDVSSGPVASNLGHAHPQIIAAIRQQLDKLTFAYARVARTRENIELSDRLTGMAGVGFERCLLVSGGSEAMDMALKFLRLAALARGDMKRTRIISLLPSYHGGTLATLAITGDLTQEEVFAPMAVFSEKIPAPLTYRPPENMTQGENESRILELLEARIRALGEENVLALVLEPVGGLATGANVLSDAFLMGASKICSHHGVFVIHDEVMSGAGRTGCFLTAHRLPEARPDVVVLAKGISAGYTPLGVMLTSAELADTVADDSGFNYAHTANANPIACAVGIAVLQEIRDSNLATNVAARGHQLNDGLRNLAQRIPVIGDVRGRGLLMAVELVSKQSTQEMFPDDFPVSSLVRRIGLEHGLMIYARRMNRGRFGDWFMVSPPLNTTEVEAEEMLGRLDQTLAAFTETVTRRGLRVAA